MTILTTYRVAIIAVVTMLIGFGAVKLFVYGKVTLILFLMCM